MDQGFALFDAEDCLLLANKRYLEANAPLAECLVPGTPSAELVAAARQADHAPGAVGWVEGSAGGYAFALPNGRHFEANRRRTSDGGFVLAWRDVTEQRAAERELARRREASFQSEKLTALGELLAGVAHELNNLLSVVVGQSLMLCEDLDDPTHLRRA
ncbi:MAG: PAS-domain containing protein, partial [Pseudomonadota bacterium]